MVPFISKTKLLLGIFVGLYHLTKESEYALISIWYASYTNTTIKRWCIVTWWLCLTVSVRPRLHDTGTTGCSTSLTINCIVRTRYLWH